MIVSVNGEPRTVGGDATVATVVELLDVAERPRGVAVAIDAEVVPRGEWDTHRLSEGDRVEVLTAIQGG